jgi:hypothetical protein
MGRSAKKRIKKIFNKNKKNHNKKVKRIEANTQLLRDFGFYAKAEEKTIPSNKIIKQK